MVGIRGRKRDKRFKNVNFFMIFKPVRVIYALFVLNVNNTYICINRYVFIGGREGG